MWCVAGFIFEWEQIAQKASLVLSFRLYSLKKASILVGCIYEIQRDYHLP